MGSIPILSTINEYIMLDDHPLIPQLKEYMKQSVSADGEQRIGEYFWSSELPSYDFTKEVLEPGCSETLPEGATGLRVDDDFWIVGIIPYEYRDVPTRELVDVLYPWIPEGKVIILSE